jgi:branched-chain amino acid transport system ATP-binding protein
LILSVKNIYSYYGFICALHGVNLHVNKGEIITLIGSNGAGKTTTFSTICGLIRPKEGEIIFNGKNITGMPAYSIAKLGIAVAPEGREIFPGLSVMENLRLGAFYEKDMAKIEEHYQRVFELFPRLKERFKQIAGTLSGGEQQMLAIGRALMSDPPLMLLDEPSLGLAPKLVELIFGIIKEINKQGITILLVEQNANMALQIADRAYVLETGHIKLEGTGDELLKNDEVRNLYLGGGKSNTLKY